MLARMSLLAGLMIAGLALAGCAQRGNIDLLEGRLRQHQDALAHAQQQLDESRSELEIAQRESQALRDQLASHGKSPILPEQANILFRADGVHFHKLLTGGLDEDQRPGDELLSALLVPHDADGEILKLPGTIDLELFDMTRPKGQQLIGEWKFDAGQSHEHWYRGFIGSGFLFRLPWQQSPQTADLLLHGRLTTADGRQFDASQQIQIAVPADAQNVTLTRFGPDANDPRQQAPTRLQTLQTPGQKAGTYTTDTDIERISPFDDASRILEVEVPDPPPLIPAPNENPVLEVPKRQTPAQRPSDSFESERMRKPNASIDVRPRRPALETSDSWTDATIPRLR
jgi:hypothetical protein